MRNFEQCRFCGCTNDDPCLVELPPVEGTFSNVMPCAWLIPGVCSAPACVEKAYLEAREVAVEVSDMHTLV
jgi:hypothetical protein